MMNSKSKPRPASKNSQKKEQKALNSKSKPRVRGSSQKKNLSKKKQTISKSKRLRSKTPKKNLKIITTKSVSRVNDPKPKAAPMQVKSQPQHKNEPKEIPAILVSSVDPNKEETKQILEAPKEAQITKPEPPKKPQISTNLAPNIESIHLNATQRVQPPSPSPRIEANESVSGGPKADKTKPLKPSNPSQMGSEKRETGQSGAVSNHGEIKSNNATKCESFSVLSPNKSKLNENKTDSIFLTTSQHFQEKKEKQNGQTSTGSKRQISKNQQTFLGNKSKSDSKKSSVKPENLMKGISGSILKGIKPEPQERKNLLQINDIDSKTLIRKSHEKVLPLEEKEKQKEIK